jgi:hypothetical protein
VLCVSKKTDRQEFKHKGECGVAEGRGRKCKKHKETRREQATGTEKTEDQKTKHKKTKEQRTGKEKEGHKRVANDPACTCSLFSSLF